MKHGLAALLGILYALHACAGEDLDRVKQDMGKIIVEREVKGLHVTIYYAWATPEGDIGYAPQLIAPDVLYGTCLLLLISDQDHKILAQGGYNGELASPVELDYSELATGTIRIYETTSDPRVKSRDGYARFSCTTLQLSENGKIAQGTMLVLTPESFDEVKAKELVEAGRAAVAADNEETLFRSIGHLRNMGLENPEAILGMLKQIIPEDNAAWNEVLGRYLGEVEWVLDERKGKR